MPVPTLQPVLHRTGRPHETHPDFRQLLLSTARTKQDAASTAVPPGTNPVEAFVSTHSIHSALLDDLAPEMTFIVHLAQELVLTPHANETQTNTVGRCSVLDARPDPRGSRVSIRSELFTDRGDVTATLRSDVLLGGVSSARFADANLPPASRPTTPPTERPGIEPLTREVTVTSDFIHRYAEHSLDSNPIHLDEAAARAAGFDAPIAHGMSVVALACEFAADSLLGGDISRIHGIGVRFSAPVLRDSPVTFELRPTASADLYALRARTRDGLALKAGWIALAPKTERN